MTPRTGVTLVGLALFAGLGCSTQTDSDAIATKAIYAAYTILSGPGATTAQASYRVGESSNTYLNLRAGDSAVCDGVTLVKVSDALGGDHYAAAVPTHATGLPYPFELRRPTETVRNDVPAVTPFSIGTPAEAASITLGVDLSVMWAPAVAGAVDITLSGPCIMAISQSANDDGADVILGTKLVQQAGVMGGCTAKLTIVRKLAGNVGEPFVGGRSDSRYTVERTLTVAP